MNRSTPTLLRRQRGLTLIELLVAVVIGLTVTLAATSVVLMGESHKRTTNSNNDTSQSGAYAAYALDRALRSAGSGFAQAWNLGTFGCRLNAARDINGTPTAILPRTASAFPAPFQGFLGGAGAAAAGNLRIAPLLIGQGQSAGGSDVLMAMSGNGSAGDVPRAIRSGVPATDNLRLDNTIRLVNGDIGLVTQTGVADCLLEQVNVTDATAFAAAGNEVLPLGGRYFTAGGTSLATLAASGTAYFSPLGNVGANNLQLQLFGVDANRTLVVYDLLRTAGDGTEAVTAPQLLADGVAELHAIYGLDTGPPYDGIADNWVAPSGTWAIANVMADPNLMRQIVAVRLAIVMRGATYEKEDVTLARPALFAGTAGEIAAAAYAAGTDNRHFRLRVIDTTIPLRNMLLLPAS